MHAPTDRRVKGTRHLLDAVERLRGEGVELELVLVEGLSHAEALAAYEQADLVVDQLLAGWYGAVAVELMALGKPVVAYIRDEDLGAIPDGMRADLPVIHATPETLADVLREWLTTRRDELPEVGRRGRAFVERWHDPRTIAARMKDAYERSVKRVPGRP
jgi:glycosyltransferase involved in cell wall biosynthesis